MFVIKRNGSNEKMCFDKITKRIERLCKKEPCLNIDPIKIAKDVIQGLNSEIHVSQIDKIAAQICAVLISDDLQYGILASRISISNHHKETSSEYLTVVEDLFNNKIVSENFFDLVKKNNVAIQSWLDYEKDYLLDFFSFKTLENNYLLRINEKIVERPQHLFLRVALSIHEDNLVEAKETYDYLSNLIFMHATPTLFNAGKMDAQMASCFLIDIDDDSIKGIFKTLADCAAISKESGGIGLSIQKIRGSGSIISKTGKNSSGIIPMLRIFNETALYVDQGGKRKGSIAVYLEPWHPDIFPFLELRKNNGAQELRCRDLFTALFIPDLFMKRVKEDKHWTLFCPSSCPDLIDLYGEEFEKRYEEYEKCNLKLSQKIRAQDLWYKILRSQIETGTPYMIYKCTSNRKNNQKNLGTLKSSNLCSEIMEYTDSKEIAVCNLASICLSKFIIDNARCGEAAPACRLPAVGLNSVFSPVTKCSGAAQCNDFDYNGLFQTVSILVKNLNKIIDRNFYPLEISRKSNFRNRPIGIGVQGLADLFLILRIPFTSLKAKEINKKIFETMYFAALSSSADLAEKYGPYPSFEGSPLSEGKFHFELGNKKPELSGLWDWDGLREKIKKVGVRNSLLIALMPTVTTSQITGNNECFEPISSNIYYKKSLCGNHLVVNKYLIQDLQKLNLWNSDMKNNLIRENGSVQNLDIPMELKTLYKTIWEISHKELIEMAVDRNYFVDQSQSFSWFIKDPDMQKISQFHMLTWEKELKTGMYYLRTKNKSEAVKFSIPPCTSCSS